MKTRKLTISAVIGALYAVLTIVLMPVTGELRFAEVLCILPWFIPESALGLFVGCIISNIFTGNIFDIIFGSLATLLAGLCTAKIRNKFLACSMPVLFNATVVGLVLAYGYGMGNFPLCAVTIAVSEAIVMYALGLPLMILLDKKKLLSKFLNDRR